MGEDISANGQSWIYDALPPETYDDAVLSPDQQRILASDGSFTVEQIDQSRFTGPFRFNTQAYEVAIPGVVVGAASGKTWLVVQVTPKHDFGPDAGVGTYRQTEQGRERISASEFFLIDPSALDESGLVRIGAGSASVLDTHSGHVIKAGGEVVEPPREDEEPTHGLKVIVTRRGEVLVSNRGEGGVRLVTPRAGAPAASLGTDASREVDEATSLWEQGVDAGDAFGAHGQPIASEFSDVAPAADENAVAAQPAFDVEQAVGGLAEIAASGDGAALHQAIGRLVEVGASERVLDQLPVLAHSGAEPIFVVNQLLATAGNEALVLRHLSKLAESGLPPMAAVNVLMATNRAEILVQHAADLAGSGVGPDQLVRLLIERDRTGLLMANLPAFSGLGLSREAVGGMLLDAQRRDFVIDHLETLLEGSNSLGLLERVVMANDLTFQSPDRLASFVSSHADLARSSDVRGYLSNMGIRYVMPGETGNNTETIFVMPLGAYYYMLPDGYRAPYDTPSQY